MSNVIDVSNSVNLSKQLQKRRIFTEFVHCDHALASICLISKKSSCHGCSSLLLVLFILDRSRSSIESIVVWRFRIYAPITIQIKRMRKSKRVCAMCCVLFLATFTLLLLMQATWRHVAIAGQNEFSEVEISMPASGRIKILQIADVQIGDMRDECKQLTDEQKRWRCNGHNTTAFIRRLIEEDRPDLVIFTGDNVYGSRGDAHSRQLMLQITHPLASSHIPFAVVIGNHDVELPWMSVSGLYQFMRRNRSSGGGAILSGNGLIRVVQDRETVVNIYLFDYMHQYCIFCLNGAHTHGSRARNSRWGGYQPVTDKQIDWFRHTSDANVTTLAFTHIPVREYVGVAEALKNVSRGHGSPWSTVVGDNFDSINSGRYGELYDALQERNVKVLSVGHDHTNDFCGRKKGGVYLCYAGGVGYTTYGRIGWPRRARMFIVEKRDFTRIRTYKRLDDVNFSRIHDEYIEEHLAG